MNVLLLTEKVIAPVNSFLRQKLITCFYHDVYGIEALTTNEKGIDIVAQQVELLFEENRSLFLGWNYVPGWPRYTLEASIKSFCVTSEKFRASEAFWQQCVGKRFSGFSIFGYSSHNEPHLLLLSFEGVEVAIANCTLEFDFVPIDVLGDDVWILMNAASIHSFIKKLGLERIEA
jgi:hypothetical protein